MPATLQILFEHFKGALLVRPVDAGAVINMAKPSVYNRVCAGTFPLPLVETSIGKMVRVTDIALYLDSLIPLMPKAAESTPARAGRPTKVEQVKAGRLGVSVPVMRAMSQVNHA